MECHLNWGPTGGGGVGSSGTETEKIEYHGSWIRMWPLAAQTGWFSYEKMHGIVRFAGTKGSGLNNEVTILRGDHKVGLHCISNDFHFFFT